MTDPAQLAANLERVQRTIAEAAARAGRDPQSVRIIAVTKGVDRETIRLAYEFGLRYFAENRVQEAKHKFSVNPLPPDAELHLIGHLQTNKVRDAIRIFDCIQSVDRLGLLATLERHLTRQERRLPILLQVNVAGEAQKHGCRLEEAEQIAEAIQQIPSLNLRGLMTIAPLTQNEECLRSVFRQLRILRDQLEQSLGQALPELSMGMSNDYHLAVEEGATMLRIGRALFGT